MLKKDELQSLTDDELLSRLSSAVHLSEPVAQLRITAARASRRYPVILTMLEDGRIHLSAIGLLAKHHMGSSSITTIPSGSGGIEVPRIFGSSTAHNL